MAIPTETTNRYIDEPSTMEVFDGETAYADDVNRVVEALNTAGDRVEAEMDLYLAETETHMDNASAYSVSAYDSSVSAAASLTTAISAATSATEQATSASDFAEITSGFMNTTSGFMNTTSGFMDTTSGFMDNASAYSVSAYDSSVSAANTYSSISGAVTTLSASSGVSGSISDNTLFIRHDDTSSQASISGTTAEAVRSVSLDGYGHVTASTLQTITPTNISALPLSGGAMSGPIDIGSSVIQFSGGAAESSRVKIRATAITLEPTSSNTLGVFVNNAQFAPLTDGGGVGTDGLNLGAPSYRWKAVYSVNGTIQTSDEEDKVVIPFMDATWLYGVMPISYRWKDEAGVVRYGFGAQDLYNKLPDKKSTVVKPGKAAQAGKPKEPWMMNYSELIPPMLKLIQEQKNMIDDLIARVEALEGGV